MWFWYIGFWFCQIFLHLLILTYFFFRGFAAESVVFFYCMDKRYKTCGLWWDSSDIHIKLYCYGEVKCVNEFDWCVSFIITNTKFKPPYYQTNFHRFMKTFKNPIKFTEYEVVLKLRIITIIFLSKIKLYPGSIFAEGMREEKELVPI